MKKTILIIAVSILIFASCKKCANCTATSTTKTSTYVLGYPKTSIVKYEACAEQLKAVNNKTTVVTSQQNNMIITVTTKTICK
jgi:thiamine biosynthesis lipoprotein ApbE